MSEGLIDNAIHHGWREIEAEVTDCRFVRVPNRTGGFPSYFAVGFKYKVNGVTYRGSQNSSVEVMRGDKFIVLYNPERPEENNSVGSMSERWWFKDYIWIVGALLLGLIVFDIIRGLFFR
jgi:hypothetical protein